MKVNINNSWVFCYISYDNNYENDVVEEDRVYVGQDLCDELEMEGYGCLGVGYDNYEGYDEEYVYYVVVYEKYGHQDVGDENLDEVDDYLDGEYVIEYVIEYESSYDCLDDGYGYCDVEYDYCYSYEDYYQDYDCMYY